jgi:hypothetical protein
MKNFKIEPYIGVGDLKFGITRADSYVILGMPVSSKKSRFSNEITDYWMENNLQLTFTDLKGLLVEISLYPDLKDAQLDGIKIFTEPGLNVFTEFCKRDNKVRETVGITIFFSYGVAMTGFLNSEDDQKSITAFAAERWNINDPELKHL